MSTNTISERAHRALELAWTIRTGLGGFPTGGLSPVTESWARWELGHDLHDELRTVPPQAVSGALLDPISADDGHRLFGIRLEPVRDLAGTDRLRLVFEDPTSR